jgi:menaquinone-dependent protoporphyrinogen oxidase
MSNILVVYATKSGCTEGIAEQIANSLADTGASVDLKRAKDKPDPSAYDAIVVGSGIRVGNWHKAAKEWVAENAETLQQKPLAFFTCGMSVAEGKDDEARGYTDALIAESHVEPVDIGLFAGWNEPDKFSLPERLILKMVKAPSGDFRDMAAADAWARSVAPQLEV